MSTTSGDIARQAFDAVDVGIIILDGEGVVRGWNDWVARASSISSEHAEGKLLSGALNRIPPARLTIAIQQAIVGGASSLLTHTLHANMLPLVGRAGAPILHNVAILPLGAAGSGCLIQITDVSASANREKVLRERQIARYNAVVDSATDAIVTIDALGVVQWINRSAELIFGYSSAELVGQPVSILISDTGNLSDAMTVLNRAAAAVGTVETPGRTRNGTRLELEFSASRWEGQGRQYITAILRDIGERKASERSLLELNESLEMMVAERTADLDRMWRLSSDIMFIIQSDGRISASNPAATTVLGWSEMRLKAANIRDLIASADLGTWDAEVAAATESHAPRLFEVRLRTAGRNERWIEWSIAVAEGDTSIQAVGRDVTAEKDAEVALRAAEDALRQSQKMEAIGQLTGGIAHDFNNLLAGVIGGLEIVKRRVSSGRYEDLNRFMEASIGAAQRAASMTHRLLAFSRQQPLDPKPHDVNAIVRGMEELMRRSLGEQVALRLNLGAGLGQAATDANQLENAILNLVINARDAMPEGGDLSITTSLADRETLARLKAAGLGAPGYIVVKVTDSGSGMSAETIAKAFDPFFTTKPIGKGTGLGLSMIYGFAKQSSGHVEITSRIGEGTTVALYLPQTRELVPAEEGVSSVQAPTGSGETVLVVEDETSVRMLIADVLQELGYTAIEVSDSRAALPILQSDARIDMMISDVGLPGMDGRRLAEVAREHRKDLKILFVTGYAQHARIKDEFLGEEMDMLTKPFTLDALGHRIRDMLAKR